MGIGIFAAEPGQEPFFSDDASVLGTLSNEATVWVDLYTQDEALLNQVAERFRLHELAIEDCLTPGHFPKIEDYGHHLFFIFRGLKPWAELDEIWSEEEDDSGRERHESYTRKVAVFLGPKFIVTFRRREMAWLDAIVRQISQDPGHYLKEGADFIAYRILDVLTDRFMRKTGFFEKLIEDFEEKALEGNDAFEVADLFELKRDLTFLRAIMRAQRAVVTRLAHETSLIQAKQRRRYFKDIDDHSLEILNILDKQINALSGIRDGYIAMSNVRLGDTMRILTVITTIAAPMNLVVGLYGMNFAKMPLLQDPQGFWIVATFMLGTAAAMLLFFRYKKWI